MTEEEALIEKKIRALSKPTIETLYTVEFGGAFKSEHGVNLFPGYLAHNELYHKTRKEYYCVTNLKAAEFFNSKESAESAVSVFRKNYSEFGDLPVDLFKISEHKASFWDIRKALESL